MSAKTFILNDFFSCQSVCMETTTICLFTFNHLLNIIIMFLGIDTLVLGKQVVK